MKVMQRAVAVKEREQGPVRDKGVNSKDCNQPDVEGYKEYNANDSDLDGLYGNQDNKGFQPNK